MANKKKKKIFVVCNAAGGAEIVTSYVKKHEQDYNFICLTTGPAEKIFKRKGLNKFLVKSRKKPTELLSDIKNLEMVLTGTSWAPSIEYDFILAAKQKKIKTVSYLDHWVNYRERFGYSRKNWENNLPEEIWVGDKYAYDLAKKFFKKLKIKLVPNQYFKEIKEKYKKININQSKKPAGGFLIISEPSLSSISCIGNKGRVYYNEFDIIKMILDVFVQKEIKEKIIIRYHPSEKRNKYNRILLRYTDKLKISKSGNQDLLEDIAEVKTVIGTESMALVIAFLCWKKAISFMPHKNKKCPLPLNHIKKIKDINELIKVL